MFLSTTMDSCSKKLITEPRSASFISNENSPEPIKLPKLFFVGKLRKLKSALINRKYKLAEPKKTFRCTFEHLFEEFNHLRPRFLKLDIKASLVNKKVIKSSLILCFFLIPNKSTIASLMALIGFFLPQKFV